MPSSAPDGDILRCAPPLCMYSNRGWSYSSLTSRTPTSAYRRRRLRLPRLPALSPLPFAILFVAAAAWYHFAFQGFHLHGGVADSVSGSAIQGARVWSARASALTAADGSFDLERVKPPDAIGVDAPG